MQGLSTEPTPAPAPAAAAAAPSMRRVLSAPLLGRRAFANIPLAGAIAGPDTYGGFRREFMRQQRARLRQQRLLQEEEEEGEQRLSQLDTVTGGLSQANQSPRPYAALGAGASVSGSSLTIASPVAASVHAAMGMGAQRGMARGPRRFVVGHGDIQQEPSPLQPLAAGQPGSAGRGPLPPQELIHRFTAGVPRDGRLGTLVTRGRFRVAGSPSNPGGGPLRQQSLLREQFGEPLDPSGMSSPAPATPTSTASPAATRVAGTTACAANAAANRPRRFSLGDSERRVKSATPVAACACSGSPCACPSNGGGGGAVRPESAPRLEKTWLDPLLLDGVCSAAEACTLALSTAAGGSRRLPSMPPSPGASGSHAILAMLEARREALRDENEVLSAHNRALRECMMGRAQIATQPSHGRIAGPVIASHRWASTSTSSLPAYSAIPPSAPLPSSCPPSRALNVPPPAHVAIEGAGSPGPAGSAPSVGGTHAPGSACGSGPPTRSPTRPATPRPATPQPPQQPQQQQPLLES